jgi:hypothetical protein
MVAFCKLITLIIKEGYLILIGKWRKSQNILGIIFVVDLNTNKPCKV